MAHIGYFLLLFFCVPTNMIRCMEDLMDFPHNIFDLQAQEKTDDICRRNCTNFNTKEDDPMLSPQEIITPEELIDQKNSFVAYNDPFAQFLDQQDPSTLDPTIDFFGFDDTSSEFEFPGEKYLTNSSDVFADRPFNTNISFNSQQSTPQNLLKIALQESNKRKLPMLSDDEYSVPSDQESDCQETSILEKRPRKKRKINTKQPKLVKKFLVDCPEPGCQKKLDSLRTFNLKRDLFSHISRKHPKNKNNYSTESVTTYVENNYKQKFLSAQEQLRELTEKDIPDDAYHIIPCNHCFRQIKTTSKYNLIRDFKNHLKNEHPDQDINEEQTKIYITKNLKKPKLLTEFSICCPEPKCQKKLHSWRKSGPNRALSNHISKKHPEKKDNYSTESVATYVESNYEQTLVPTQKKTSKEDIPDDAYHIISCSHCSRQIEATSNYNLIRDFKNHLKNEHPDQDINEEQTKIYITKNLKKPKLLTEFSICCPEPKCQKKLHSWRKSDLKKVLSSHISKKHPEKKDNYSTESVETYVNKNVKKNFFPVLKQTKKEDVPDNVYRYSPGTNPKTRD